MRIRRVGKDIIEEDDGKDYTSVEAGYEWEDKDGHCRTCWEPYFPDAPKSQNSRCPICQHRNKFREEMNKHGN